MESGLTGQFVLILIIFIPISICGDVGAGFGVPHVLHLVGVLLYAYFAEVGKGTPEGGHVALRA